MTSVQRLDGPGGIGGVCPKTGDDVANRQLQLLAMPQQPRQARPLMARQQREREAAPGNEIVIVPVHHGVGGPSGRIGKLGKARQFA
jgi:hypothetical protein